MQATAARWTAAIMRIVDIRETAVPLNSTLANSSIDFTEMTTSVVA
jgi:D(-)-tartrate dehydratase